MRPAVVLLLGLVAGCVGGDVDDAGDDADDAVGPGQPAANATEAVPEAQMGDRYGALETFLFTSDHALEVLPAAAAPREAARVPETTAATEFYKSVAQDVTLVPWTSPPFAVPFEAAEEITVTLAFVSDQPAVSATKAVSFAPVGGWLGTAERFAAFFQMADAPDTLEAGKVVVLTAKIAPPPGGFFFRQGEALSVHTFLAYQTAAGGTPSYVIGGETPSAIALPHEHFNLTAPVATVLLQQEGTFQPNPSVTSTDDPSARTIDVTVPPDAALVVFELTSTPGPSGRLDADLQVLGAGGELGAGTGPHGKETVVVGPSGLATGRALAVRVQSASTSGGTWTLVATAYS